MTRSATAVMPVLIICCIVYRYIQAIQRFVKRRFKVARYGLRADAGGTLGLLRGPRAVRAWIWRNLTLAYQRQGVRRVFVFHHQDCLLYGGSAAFASPKQEAAAHLNDLRRAKALITKRFPRLHISAFYAHQTARGIQFNIASS